MNTTKDAIYNERHRQMLAYQNEVKPFPPTHRGLEKVWGLSTTSAVSYVLKNLTKRGLVKELPKGKYRQYLAVEVEDGSNS